MTYNPPVSTDIGTLSKVILRDVWPQGDFCRGILDRDKRDEVSLGAREPGRTSALHALARLYAKADAYEEIIKHDPSLSIELDAD